jgi:hypothetical protein
MTDNNLILDLIIHSFLLFLFLNLFFWLYASNMEKKALSNQIDSTVSQIPYIMDNITILDTNHTIDLKLLRPKVQKIFDESKESNPKMVENNNKLLMASIGIILLFLGFILYLVRYYKNNNYNIDYALILKNNAFTLFFLCIIEFLFFTFIISKYVPVRPDFMLDSLISRIKKRYSEQIIE